jgi:hypothetical protein
MSLSKSKITPRMDYGSMERRWTFFEALESVDLDAARNCLKDEPECIRLVDEFENNAMHLCILAGASRRAPQLIRFLLDETEIDLLHENKNGMDPLRLAEDQCDEVAAALMEPYWQRQIRKRFGVVPAPELALVVSASKSDDDPDLSPR